MTNTRSVVENFDESGHEREERIAVGDLTREELIELVLKMERELETFRVVRAEISRSRMQTTGCFDEPYPYCEIRVAPQKKS